MRSRGLTVGSVLAARLYGSREGTILCYHGIERAGRVGQGSPHVSPRQFEGTIALARDIAEAVSLRELIARQVAGRSTAGLFAVTFDDADVSLASDPVLARIDAGLPITIFTVSGASAAGSTFWWDRVAAAHSLASEEVWHAFEHHVGLPAAFRTQGSVPYGPLRPLRQWVLSHHAGRWPEHAEDPLVELEVRVKAHSTHRAMTFAELDQLTRRGHVDVAVHTVTHPVLSLLGDDEVRAELRSCHAALRERWPSTLPWVAAPYGLYDERTARLTRDAGLEGMLSVNARTLAHVSGSHGLPRRNVMEAMPAWKLGLHMGGLLPRIRSGKLQYPARPGPD